MTPKHAILHAIARVSRALTSVQIGNPFAGFVVGWTWAQHRAQGYQGGTDYIFYPSDGDIVAAADGQVVLAPGENGFTPGSAIILKLADGRSINYREVATTLVTNGQWVTRGQSLGISNWASRWPHIDATVAGLRVPFEPLVNLSTAPAGGGGTPVPYPALEIDMSKQIIYRSGTVVVQAAPATPAPGTLQEFDFEKLTYRTLGPGEAYCQNANRAASRLDFFPVDDATFATVYAGWTKVTAPIVSAGGGTAPFDPTAILNAIAALDSQADGYQQALKTLIEGIPGATIKAEGAALSNG